MYVAMNRFPIAAGREEEFLQVWRERESHLDSVPGFVGFRLLQGERRDGETIVISHSEWASRQAFADWTGSEAFASAHRRARSPEGVVLRHPEFEGYDVVLS